MSLKATLIEIAKNLVQAKNERFAQHPLAEKIRKELPSKIQATANLDLSKYSVSGSPGQGNWAEVPWAAIFRKDITNTAQEGVYPVYLFKADGSGIYLSLGLGATELRKQGLNQAKQISGLISNKIRTLEPALKSWPRKIDIIGKRDTDKGKDYEWATAGAKFYDINFMPNDDQLAADLKELLSIYSIIDINLLKKLSQSDQPVVAQNTSNKLLTYLPKPFILLAGISGTGKTRFIREQAKASGTLDENYELVAVRPDWHEPSDLLGYISRLSNNGAEYITTDVVKFLAKAWRAIFDAGLTIKGERNGLVLIGESDQLNELRPYWLCLDEMNLAPVEQYFSDYLSILETREWEWSDSNNFTYRCDAILTPSLFKQVAKSNIDKLQEDVGLENHQELWELILEHGLSIPPNLIVAGTVNMDETTYGFSRKVIDRALSFDFGEFFPNDYEQFFKADTKPKALTFPIWSQATEEDLSSVTIDSDGKKTIGFLTAVNAELKNSPFELAYRALNELLLSVVAFKPQDDAELQAVWDDFLMCKVLPRIEGDLDKLQGENGILAKLETLLEKELAAIWDGDESRKDLYRTKENGDDVNVACRSKKKLAWMKERLSTAGFTSFWP